MPRPPNSDAELKALAIHEAGRAVVGRALLLSCGRASIIHNEDSDGHSIICDVWSTLEARERFRDPSSALRARIMASLAGAEAEAVILGRCCCGDVNDRRQIELVVASVEPDISPEHWRESWSRMRRQARRFARLHRYSIERVAAALIARKTLQPPEIHKFIKIAFTGRRN